MPFKSSAEASAAAHTSWSKTTDRAARTEAARQAQIDAFEVQVDPERRMSASDRAKAVQNARQARWAHMRANSIKTRTAQKLARRADAGIEGQK